LYFYTNEFGETSTALGIRGPDAYTYLQGQLTQDLNRSPGSAAYGLWLDQKGKVVADSTVLRRKENDFLVICRSATAEALRIRLESYLVADEVDLADESEAWLWGQAWGEGAAGAIEPIFGRLPERGEFVESRNGLLWAGRAPGRENFEWLSPRSRAAEVSGAFVRAGARSADLGLAERERILAGVVAVPADIGPGDLPNEGGLEETAISFTKGCYLGQEVMSRLKNLGQVRRRLHLIRGPGACPPPRTALQQAGRKVGEIRSASADGDGFVAMAMVSLIQFDPAEPMSLEPGGRPEIRVLRRV